MVPVALQTDTKEWVKLVLYTFVIPGDMAIPLFISWSSLYGMKPQWGITNKKLFMHLENENRAFNITGL